MSITWNTTFELIVLIDENFFPYYIRKNVCGVEYRLTLVRLGDFPSPNHFKMWVIFMKNSEGPSGNVIVNLTWPAMVAPLTNGSSRASGVTFVLFRGVSTPPSLISWFFPLLHMNQGYPRWNLSRLYSITKYIIMFG